MAHRLTGHDLVNAAAFMHRARLANRARRSFRRGRISRIEMERRITCADNRHRVWLSFYDHATRDRARALDNQPMRHRKGEIREDFVGGCADCDCELNLGNPDRFVAIRIGGWDSDDEIHLCLRCAEDREADDDGDFDVDEEYEHNRRVVEYVSGVCGGLTGSEVRDIMCGD